MKGFLYIVAAVLASSVHAHPRDARSTFDLLKKGRNLSAKDAEKLEERVKKRPDDEEDRIQLLSYYAGPPKDADLSTVKAARARHIFWIIENDPKDGLGLFQVATGVYRLHCQGDDLADPDAFKQAGAMWLEQLRKNPGNDEIRREAVRAIQFCSPEPAEPILIEAKYSRTTVRREGSTGLRRSNRSRPISGCGRNSVAGRRDLMGGWKT